MFFFNSNPRSDGTKDLWSIALEERDRNEEDRRKSGVYIILMGSLIPFQPSLLLVAV